MKLIKVVDASVALKWFVEEEGRGAALTVLEEIKTNPTGFVVPELFFNEMLSIFCRLEPNENKVMRYLTLLEELGWERISNGRELLRKATTWAVTYKITGYDAIYVATAILMNGVWLTSDSQAHHKITKHKISQLII